MKAIIFGKRYDTKTATELVTWSNEYGQSDFRWCVEGLYVTKKGNYFLSGRGGPMTKYARSAGSNASIGGCGIIPLTSQEALEWCEMRMLVDVAEQIKGVNIEDA